MITSTSNQQMKNLTLLMKKAKARNEQGVFVAEGRKMFLEAPVEWVKQVYVSESFYGTCTQGNMQDCMESVILSDRYNGFFSEGNYDYKYIKPADEKFDTAHEKSKSQK